MSRRRAKEQDGMKQGSLLAYFAKKTTTEEEEEGRMGTETREEVYGENLNGQNIVETGDSSQGDRIEELPKEERERERIKDAIEDATKEEEINVEPRKRKAEDNGLSEYEKKRLEKMQQNAAFLAALGIEKPVVQSTKARKPEPKRREKKIMEQQIVPLRRSSRSTAKLEQVQDAQELKATNEVLQESTKKIKETHFPDTCALFDYMCMNEAPVKNENGNEINSSSYILTGDESLDRSDSNLKRVYSMDAFDNLLVGAGHNGFLSIYSRNPTFQSTPLLSFRAHQGWSSGVSFQLSTSSKTLLLTASNDSFVKLWDLDRATSTLKEAASTSDIHSSGIFSLDVQKDNGIIATGSKDQNICLSKVAEASIELVQAFEYHQGVVKCIRFAPQDRSMLASCGNDMKVYVHDTRTSTCNLELVSHTRATNCVRWSPRNEHTLLSAAFDGVLNVWDTRNPSAPVVSYGTSDTKRMFPVEFLDDGNIIAGVDRALLVFDTMSKCTRSRGALGYDADTIFVDHVRGDIVVAHGKTLARFVMNS